MVVRADYFQELAQQNRIRSIPLKAPRGLIQDRKGIYLVDNVHSFSLFLFRDRTTDLDETKRFLVDGLKVDPVRLEERLQQATGLSRFQPVRILEDLEINDIAYILAHQAEYPDLSMFEQPKRRYRHGLIAAHALGYVGEVSLDELGKDEFNGARPGDIVGKAGIERSYNRHLTGEDGVRQVVVNSQGKILQEFRRTEPVEGKGLHLTIDFELQEVAEQALEDSPGAVVALDPRNGEILVMASHPTFDSNAFASRLSPDQWRELIEDPGHPLQNRAIQNTFSPGSIFKIVMALAGLETGLISERTSFYCPGAVRIYGHPFRCWKAGGHGRVTLREAIQHSCNVYFYQLGKALGIQQIAEFSRRLGLGSPTGIELQGEVSGLVPTEEWKKRTTGEPWYAGETISVSIGQGPVNVTPLQLARMVGVVATGQTPQLHLVADQVADPRPTSESTLKPPTEEHLQIVREAMWRSVNAWGTGRGAQVVDFEVCGKTGTAQTISATALKSLAEEDQEKYVPNAWFTGFAPLDDPEIVVAVIVQRGGSGGSAAAPVAGKVFQRYFQEYQKRHQPREEIAMRN
jgi:penicillin-binding protein 2